MDRILTAKPETFYPYTMPTDFFVFQIHVHSASATQRTKALTGLVLVYRFYSLPFKHCVCELLASAYPPSLFWKNIKVGTCDVMVSVCLHFCVSLPLLGNGSVKVLLRQRMHTQK
jgi:hypothetical protein